MISRALPGVYSFGLSDYEDELDFVGDIREMILTHDVFREITSNRYCILENGLVVNIENELVRVSEDREIMMRITTVCPEDLEAFLQRISQKRHFLNNQDDVRAEFEANHVFPNKFEYMRDPDFATMMMASSSSGVHRFFVSPAGQFYEEDVAFRNEKRDDLIYNLTGDGKYTTDIETATRRKPAQYTRIERGIRGVERLSNGVKKVSSFFRNFLS